MSGALYMKSLDTFEGIFSAVPTPFGDDGSVDLAGLVNLMSWQRRPNWVRSGQGIKQQAPSGVSGFVLYGTTGEAPTLSLNEKEMITQTAMTHFSDMPLIAGVGTNSTTDSRALAHQVRSWGVDAGLLVTPYYNKPSQEGIYRHVLSVAEAVADWPLVLYVVPSRASVTLELETVDRILTACPQVIAIKDATADLNYCSELVSYCADRATILSGDDQTALAAWSTGARGSISVSSNLLPAEMMRLWHLFNQGKLIDARTLFLSLHPLINALFVESNPTPLKAALSYMTQQGIIQLPTHIRSIVRLPLADLEEANAQALIQTINAYLTMVEEV
jgi:4-hydroxy-tetrahydrodipicolinate synthase